MDKSNTSSESNGKMPSVVYVIFLYLIIDLLGFTVILPLMPSMLDHYSSNTEDVLYHWLESKVQYFQHIVGAPDIYNRVLFGGLLGSLFSILQFFVTPVIGALSDVYGRKPLLIFTMCGIGLSHMIWAVSDSFYLFVLSRIIGGISRGNVSLSTAVVTDVCCVRRRGKGMALIGVAFSIGFILGPTIGAIFAVHTSSLGNKFYVMPAAFAATLAVIDVIFIWIYFKESLPQCKRAKSIGNGLSEAFKFINPLSLFSFKPVQNISNKDIQFLQQIGRIYFIFLFLYSGLEYSLTFLAHNRFMFTSMQQGKMYLFSGIIMVIIQGGYVRKVRPGEEIKCVYKGLIVIIVSFIVIGLARSVNALYVGLAMYAFASATVVPCLTTLVSKFGSADQKGTLLGIFRSLGSLARGFGPFTTSIAYWSFGSSVCYCIGGILLLVPLILTKRLQNNLENREKMLEKAK